MIRRQRQRRRRPSTILNILLSCALAQPYHHHHHACSAFLPTLLSKGGDDRAIPATIAITITISPRFTAVAITNSGRSRAASITPSSLHSTAKHTDDADDDDDDDENDDDNDNERRLTTAVALNQTAHIALLDRELQRQTQQGLLEHMGLGLLDPTTDSHHHEENDEEDTHVLLRRKKGWQDDVHLSMRFALMSHGAENGMDGPVHNYVNFGACSAFQLSRSAFLNLPAARVADPGMDQEQWSIILQRLREQQDNGSDSDSDSDNTGGGGGGVLESYQGYRTTLMQRDRFYIRDAVVWNCYTDSGDYYGQAILFDREKVAFVEGASIDFDDDDDDDDDDDE